MMADMDEISKPKLRTVYQQLTNQTEKDGNLQHTTNCGDSSEKVDILNSWKHHLGGPIDY
jgi:hypothetical protein